MVADDEFEEGYVRQHCQERVLCETIRETSPDFEPAPVFFQEFGSLYHSVFCVQTTDALQTEANSDRGRGDWGELHIPKANAASISYCPIPSLLLSNSRSPGLGSVGWGNLQCLLSFREHPTIEGYPKVEALAAAATYHRTI